MQEEKDLQVLDYSQYLQEIKESIENNNESIENLIKFFETEKEEEHIINQEKEEEQKIQEEEQKKQLLEEQKIIEKEKEQQKEFYSNIETIALNSDTEVTTQLLTDVSTLLQASVMTNGLLIGIVCISLFAKFFKK